MQISEFIFIHIFLNAMIFRDVLSIEDNSFGRTGHFMNHHKSPAIMTPVSTISVHNDFGLPDVTLTSQFTSLKLTPDYNDSDEESDSHSHSFLLLDEKERLKVC